MRKPRPSIEQAEHLGQRQCFPVELLDSAHRDMSGGRELCLSILETEQDPCGGGHDGHLQSNPSRPDKAVQFRNPGFIKALVKKNIIEFRDNESLQHGYFLISSGGEWKVPCIIS
jgi:hypothetical protein